MITFFKDWLPSVAVVVGGIWILIQWIIGERLRKTKEMEALDGSLTAQAISLDPGRAIVTLNGLWRNLSPLPIHVNASQTRVDVFHIPDDVKIGPLHPKQDLGAPAFRHPFLADLNGFVLEPKTESTLQTHFVLASGLYVFRMKIYWDQKKHRHVKFAWTRELVFDMREPQQPPERDK